MIVAYIAGGTACASRVETAKLSQGDAAVLESKRNEHTKYLSAESTTDRSDGGFEKGAELDAF